MSFSHFSLEASRRGNCTYDYLEVRRNIIEIIIRLYSKLILHFEQITESSTSALADRTSLGRFCGDTIPAMIASTKDNVFVHFESDASHAMSGFRMEWVLNGRSNGFIVPEMICIILSLRKTCL